MMTTVLRASATQVSYDSVADVFYVFFKEAELTDGVETEAGFFVHYTWPEHELAGVTIMDFHERFGEDPARIEIDVDPPLVIVLRESAEMGTH